MANLIRYEQDGIEILIDNETGESFASISGYARMSGKDKSTISRRLQSVAENGSQTAEILTPGGLQGVALINEDLITDWIQKDNPDIAKKLIKLGVRGLLHQMAGFQVKSTAVQTPQSYIEALEALVASEKEKERLKERTEQLNNVVGVLETKNKELTNFKEQVDEYPNFKDLLEIVEKDISPLDCFKSYKAYDFLKKWNKEYPYEYVHETKWATVAKRAAHYYRVLEGEEPRKNRQNNPIYRGKSIAYLIATIKLVNKGYLIIDN